MTETTAIIQARTGSTRLPGKVVYPLDGVHTLAQVVRRVSRAETVDDTVVATSTEPPDDVIKRYAPMAGADVVRGSESDVLSRFHRAAKRYSPDILVRITSDCPLISPETIDEVVRRLGETGADYSTNIIERTFPRGLDVEAFTFESFERVHTEATTPHHREHVTPYYREHDDQFDLVSVTSEEVFDKPWMQNRTDLRLTLDEAADYKLLWEIYDRIEYDEILPVRDAIKLVDEQNLQRLNVDIEQKHLQDASDDSS
jgi:spore coat polysaccharide biosynthesis protein SpsF